MKVARFVLKIVALSLTTAAVVCAVIAYWDKVAEFCGCKLAFLMPDGQQIIIEPEEQEEK